MSSNIEFVNTALNGGFLSGFVEASVEKPEDGLNGECIVHFSGQYSDAVMKVKMANGKREGIAEIAMDGVPYIKLEYRNGKMTGIVERMNDNEVVDLKGHLVDGRETGQGRQRECVCAY